MKSIFDIRVQKLFLMAFALKVGSSFLGWKFKDPWILGLAVPLIVMSAYIVLGYFRRDDEVTDEKFADTCYYLGFIFTISSIIFCLFDLPSIGTEIQNIAVRFGAAMVSTVLGLAVRVYLVSFKKEAADAIKDAETAVLDATRKFTEQLTVALERLRDFEGQVDTAAKASVERVNLQVENLSKNHAEKLASFFADLTNRNQEAFTSALTEVKSASQKLAKSVDGYSLGMRDSLGSIEAKVDAFADAVTERLKTTTFPDDYFAERLSSPLLQMKESSAALAGGIKDSLKEVTESAAVLSSALKKLRDKASATEYSLELVLKLTQQQQAVLETAQGQTSSLEQLNNTLKKIEETLETTVAGVASSSALTSDLTSRIGGIVADGVETRKTLELGLGGVTETLKAQVQATKNMVATLTTGATASNESTQLLVSKIDAVAVADMKAVEALDALGRQATSALGRVDGAAERLQGMVRQVVTSLDAGAVASKESALHLAVKLDSVAVADMKTADALEALSGQATAALGRVDAAVEQLQGMVLQLAGLDATLQANRAESRLVESAEQALVVGALPLAFNTAPPSSQPFAAFLPAVRESQLVPPTATPASEQASPALKNTTGLGSSELGGEGASTALQQPPAP
jgi:hypothetical protein